MIQYPIKAGHTLENGAIVLDCQEIGVGQREYLALCLWNQEEKVEYVSCLVFDGKAYYGKYANSLFQAIDIYKTRLADNGIKGVVVDFRA